MHTTATGMTPRIRTAPRWAFTALVATAEVAHLAFEHVNGGIARHHLLADPTLPSISNGWGLLVLPLLAWIASRHAFDARAWPTRAFVVRLLGAMLAGLALSVAFTTGAQDLAGALFVGILLAALVLRGYRAEHVLGLALGMAWAIGGVLPVLVGGCIALVSAAFWFLVVPIAKRAMRGRRSGATA